MKVTFVHPRGAGQFQHLAAHLTDLGADITVVCEAPDVPISGVRFVRHAMHAGPKLDHHAAHISVAGRYAQLGHHVAETLEKLKRAEGRPPDLLVGHIGWGGLLFAKDVLPTTPALGYCEYYFNPRGGDLGFDPAEPATIADLERARLRNMVQRATLDAIDGGFSPTAWQRSRYPGTIQTRIALCHEGIDTARCRPDTGARLALPNGRTLAAGDPIVTYVARSLEPYRGFPQFMRAAARIAEKRADVTFVVAGDDDVSYGRKPTKGGSWREVMVKETGIDPGRIVFLGAIDHRALVRLFQVSAAHVYLTIPFVLSWSMLEAMACGCLVVASRTAPVEEVVIDERNGLLVDFFDTEALADRILAALDRPEANRGLRQTARLTIERRFRRADCLDRQVRILNHVMTRASGVRAG